MAKVARELASERSKTARARFGQREHNPLLCSADSFGLIHT